MPTAHRQRMIDAGLAPPHHGHDKRAVKEAAVLEQADQALLDQAAADAVVAQEVADKAKADKRVAQASRHADEREAKKFRRKTPAKKA